MIVEPSKPVRWSYRYDAKTRRELQAGRRRIGITVNAYEPPTSGPAIFVVSLVNAEGIKRKEIHRFGVHPNTPFRAGKGRQPQRFLISLKDDAAALDPSELRLGVGFDSSGGKVKGGKAEITIGFVDL
jgi:hypothetical protein